jgi:hypothetical protein
LAIGARVIIGEGTRREEGRAFVAVQGAVLAGEELAAAVFAHGSWAGGTIGFACGHFGEEALKGRRKSIKIPCSQETTKSQTKYITQG